MSSGRGLACPPIIFPLLDLGWIRSWSTRAWSFACKYMEAHPCVLTIPVRLEIFNARISVVVVSIQTVHGCLRGGCTGTTRGVSSHQIQIHQKASYSMNLELTCRPYSAHEQCEPQLYMNTNLPKTVLCSSEVWRCLRVERVLPHPFRACSSYFRSKSEVVRSSQVFLVWRSNLQVVESQEASVRTGPHFVDWCVRCPKFSGSTGVTA